MGGTVSDDLGIGAGHSALMEAPVFGIQVKKLTMWLFIMSDALTFGGFLFAYGYTRVSSPNWGAPFEIATILNGIVMTVVLLTSGLTMLAAVSAAKSGDKPRSVRWLGATMLLGAIFAALHLREWFKLFGEGWRMFRNPTGGAPQFGAAFFSITGLHMAHVIVGVIVIAFITMGFRSGRFDSNHVETTGLYWHFVDIVWMFVFPLMYLLNAR